MADKIFANFVPIIRPKNKVVSDVQEHENYESSKKNVECINLDDDVMGNDLFDEEYINIIVDDDEDEIFVRKEEDNVEVGNNVSEKIFGKNDIDEVVPYVNQKFENLESAESLFRAYALRNGFGIKIQVTQKRAKVDEIYARRYVCRLAGQNKSGSVVDGDEEVSLGSSKGKRRRDIIPRSGCRVCMYIVKKRKTSYWEITTLELEHNHELVTPTKMQLIQRERHVTTAARNILKTLHMSGVPPRQSMDVFSNIKGGVQNVGFGSQHIRNVVRDERRKRLDVNDAQAGMNLLNKLKDDSGGNFFMKTQVDEEQRLKSIVWVDSRCLMAYKNFGDVVAFDTTYRTNRYSMPFVPFTGVNHHYQSVIFGFALMRDEVRTSFE